MRERAAALGGTLATGPGPGGGFRVEAWLPIPKPSEESDHGATSETADAGEVIEAAAGHQQGREQESP
jgi:hypothetical protein